MINENNTKKSMKGGMMADGDVAEFANVQLAFQQADAADYVGNQAMIRYGQYQPEPMNWQELIIRSDRGEVLTDEEMQAVTIGRSQRVLLQTQRAQESVVNGQIPHKDNMKNIQYSASAGACCCITVNAAVRAATTHHLCMTSEHHGCLVKNGQWLFVTGKYSDIPCWMNRLPTMDSARLESIPICAPNTVTTSPLLWNSGMELSLRHWRPTISL